LAESLFYSEVLDGDPAKLSPKVKARNSRLVPAEAVSINCSHNDINFVLAVEHPDWYEGMLEEWDTHVKARAFLSYFDLQLGLF